MKKLTLNYCKFTFDNGKPTLKNRQPTLDIGQPKLHNGISTLGIKTITVDKDKDIRIRDNG